MGETKTYAGGCHCGAVRFEVELDLSRPVRECNCSHCAKKGFLLCLTPVESFRLISGADALTEYRFNTELFGHRFCRTCGVQSFCEGHMPDGAEVRAINVRCLDDVDVSELAVTLIDGRSV